MPPLRPLPLHPARLKDVPCFISTSECNNLSHNMHPICKVVPSLRGVVFLLKSTSMIVESHSGHRSRVVDILCAPWGRKTRQLHMLQYSLHFGALTGSRTRVPLHSGQAHTPRAIKECWQVGCGQRKQGMPAPLPNLPELPILRAPKRVSIPSNGGLL